MPQLMNTKPSQVDVVILCGGLGTRLRKVVSDRPKPMALIENRPFLEILIQNFLRAGFGRFVLCTGHLSDSVAEHFANRYSDLSIVISEENRPLGTAGAIKNAEHRVHSNPFLVTNGDSYCDIDLEAFCRFHDLHRALLSIVLAPSKDTRDYGRIEVGEAGRITTFAEKTQVTRPGLINAGIYLFEKSILQQIPADRKTSLEHEIFPELGSERCFGYVGASPVLDIGTPERYRRASTYFAAGA